MSIKFVHAIDDTRLWLPKSYSHYFSKLRRAARTAEKTDRCDVVVRGQLHEKRSSLDHPVYRIICRDVTRKTYSVLIDGLTYEDLSPPPPAPPPPPPPPEIILPTETELAAVRYEKYWPICQQALTKRTSRMMGLIWITTDMPVPDQSIELQDQFVVDFDAVSMQKKPLFYRALCTFTRELVSAEELEEKLRSQAEKEQGTENDEKNKDEQSEQGEPDIDILVPPFEYEINITPRR